ncbi:endonuclease/exonuclease/phosphatase family protein [Maribellus maritimus]|uniref:endonuclease/exonuclease/phosphatase family protein n=1 Tax=Maribellus maritimus TaxID=2870838 RepID=UPI001EEA817C|nr:endonuclease/exonuclease/phosphatase family protein [Maribellus maritimus]MCG6185797.1 endonuclease/exonuclease/phosphatase family protein [Maribellus maritimus]
MKKCIFFLSAFLIFTGVKSQEEQTIRVLTFNILHGATTKGDFDLDKIASVIKQTNPDVVALQEVDFKTRRARGYDLATELGWRTKMAPLFGKAMDYDCGGYGEGVLSKYPIISSKNVLLPHSPKNEPRAALEITIELPSGDTICFIGTHLDHLANSVDRITQTQKINRVFSENKYPTILAGDLNATPESEAIGILESVWTDVYQTEAPFTFPSDKPNRKIDYILYKPASKWKVIETKIICDSIASDHCAHFAILKLQK